MNYQTVNDFKIISIKRKSYYEYTVLAQKDNINYTAVAIEINSKTTPYINNMIYTSRTMHYNINMLALSTIFTYLNYACFVYEHCEIGTLHQYISKLGNRIEEQEAINIIRDIINGYGSINNNDLIHNSISPQCIYIKKTSENDICAKIGGFITTHKKSNPFGILPRKKRTQFDAPDYDKNANESADIYSIGATYLYMLCGKVLPINASMNSIKKLLCSLNISETSQDFILQTLNSDSNDRISFSGILEHDLVRMSTQYILENRI